MARYRLTKPHYLKTQPPTEWEQREQSQQTGKEARIRVEVPMLIEEGQTISTREEDALPEDVVVALTSPSNEMVPLDKEAERELAKMEAVWQGRADPVESLPVVADMSALGAVAVAKPARVGRRF